MSSIGVIIGRFQVDNLHPGHIELFERVKGMHPVVICFLGVPRTIGTRRNPLDFFTRKLMIQDKFPDVMVLAIPDQPTDDLWSAELDKRIAEIAPLGGVKLYGGRDSFIPHYKGKFKVERLRIERENSGTSVREKSGQSVMESSAFRTGVIYATQNRYPAAIPCVDIAILDRQEGPHILLAQKAGESSWRFVGGHVDPTDESLEDAAGREVMEETGLPLDEIEYVSSHRIPDWRWREEPDKIITTLFIGYNSMGAAKAQDDIAAVKWFSLNEVKTQDIAEVHRPLYNSLRKHLGLEINVKPDSEDGLVQTDALEAVPAWDGESLLVP